LFLSSVVHLTIIVVVRKKKGGGGEGRGALSKGGEQQKSCHNVNKKTTREISDGKKQRELSGRSGGANTPTHQHTKREREKRVPGGLSAMVASKKKKGKSRKKVKTITE
jgi:hypothetical protein